MSIASQSPTIDLRVELDGVSAHFLYHVARITEPVQLRLQGDGNFHLLKPKKSATPLLPPISTRSHCTKSRLSASYVGVKQNGSTGTKNGRRSIARSTRTIGHAGAEIILTAVLGHGLVGIAYTATVGGQKIVAKVARTGFEKDLRHEGTIYSTYLTPLYGTAVPPCFGLFEGDGKTVLITANCGNSLVSFADVNLSLR